MNRTLPILTLITLLSCSRNQKLPPVEELETAQHPRRKTAIQQPHGNPEKLFAALDKCTKYRYCGALDRLNLYFASHDKEHNYPILIAAAASTSARIASYALFRLYPYTARKGLPEALVPILDRNSDRKVQKLGLTLLLLSRQEVGTAYVLKRWDTLPAELKLALVWVVRKIASSLPPPFIEGLQEEPLPSLRALALELKVGHSNDLSTLVACVKALSPQSGHCALSLGRLRTPAVAPNLIALFDHFQKSVRGRRRRLAVPPQLFDTLERLNTLALLSKKRGYGLAKAVLINRKFSDKFRGRAARYIGEVGTKEARLLLDRYRKDRRRRVGYAVRRAIYLMEKKG